MWLIFLNGAQRLFSGLALFCNYHLKPSQISCLPWSECGVIITDKAAGNLRIHSGGGMRPMAIKNDVTAYETLCILGIEKHLAHCQ